MAKAWTSDACRRVCAAAHQIHGGIGFTKEYDLQLYFRRAKQGEVSYGDADIHREVGSPGYWSLRGLTRVLRPSKLVAIFSYHVLYGCLHDCAGATR